MPDRTARAPLARFPGRSGHSPRILIEDADHCPDVDHADLVLSRFTPTTLPDAVEEAFET